MVVTYEQIKQIEAEDKKEVKENGSLSPNLELTEDKAVYHTSWYSMTGLSWGNGHGDFPQNHSLLPRR